MEQTTLNGIVPRRRILFMVTKSVLGGAQRYVYDLACSLPRDSYDVAVAFGGTGIPGSEPGILNDMLIGAGVRTIFVPELGRDLDRTNDTAAYRALRALFEREQPDIVHLNSPKAGGLGALAARLSGVPRIIYTAHGWAFSEHISFPGRVLRFLLSYMTILLADRVICVSNSDREKIAWIPFIRSKLIVIHNGIRAMSDLTRIEARDTLLSKEETALHELDLWLVSIAEHTKNKNLFSAIEAVQKANKDSAAQKIFYCIIGDGEQREKLQRFIEERKLTDSVRLLGFVAESRRYLPGFDAMLMPSIKEGLPYAILEAGMAELPVAASYTGGIPDIITHNETGILIINPKSSDEIATAIGRLRDPVLRSRFGEALKKHVESAFSFEQMRNDTFALY
jgi:glycosyltransferase involved in cell wall biosynthesis